MYSLEVETEMYWIKNKTVVSKDVRGGGGDMKKLEVVMAMSYGDCRRDTCIWCRMNKQL